MKMPELADRSIIAFCGVNCLACSAFLDIKNPCPGCRHPAEVQKRKSCINCAKKKCAVEHRVNWCFECPSYPCGRIKSLNQTYQKNDQIDLIKNGNDAKSDFTSFLHRQQMQLTCPFYGGIINQHCSICSECGKEAACSTNPLP